jgi:hypothetical protein
MNGALKDRRLALHSSFIIKSFGLGLKAATGKEPKLTLHALK